MKNLLVTVLTGGRPALLGLTLRALRRQVPDLLEEARVVAFVNGGDAHSVALLRSLDTVDVLLVEESQEILPIGEAVSHLMAHAGLEGADYLLHLEDDWSCTAKGWLDPAVRILSREPKVGQVRLRRWRPTSFLGASVSRYHMLTQRPIKWSERRLGAVRYALGQAHYTFNPSLVSTETAASLFPCTGERDAAARFGSQGLWAAQLLPGAFSHIGGGSLSLRERLGRGSRP